MKSPLVKKIRLLFVGFSILAHLPLAQAKPQIPVDFEKDTRVPLVYLNVVINGGSVHDPSEKEGMTQLMGEMMLRGTSLRSKSELDLALDQLGATLAVETRAEALILRGAVLATELETFLDIVEEVATSPRFDEEEIQKIKAEANAALLSEMGRDSAIASKKFTRYLFKNGHPYGSPISGTRTSLAKITKEDLVRHHQAFFRVPNLSIIALGDTSQRVLEAFATKLSRRLPASEPLPKIHAPTLNPGRSVLLIDKPDRTQTQVMGGQLGVKLDHPDYFPLYLGNFAYGGGSFNSRLMQEIRVKRGWSYGAYSAFRHGLEPRSWTFSFAPASKDCVSATKLGLDMVQTLKDTGITAQEFETAKSSLINSSAFMYNTPQKRAENRILEVTLHLQEGFMERYRPELTKTSLEDVNAALRRFLQPENLKIGILGDAKTLKADLQKSLQITEEQIEVTSYDRE